MKRLYMYLSLLIISSSLFAQKYNCVIFIDGKMPYGVTKSYFEFKDSLENTRRIDFEYYIGDIFLSNENNKILQKLKSEKSLEMHFTVENNDFVKSYIGEIAVGWLSYDYLVIRITNLKKGKYYFAYSTPGIVKAWIKKEYHMIGDP